MALSGCAGNRVRAANAPIGLISMGTSPVQAAPVDARRWAPYRPTALVILLEQGGPVQRLANGPDFDPDYSIRHRLQHVPAGTGCRPRQAPSTEIPGSLASS